MLKKLIKSLLRIICATAMAAVVLCVGLMIFAEHIIFQPPPRTDTHEKYTFIKVGENENIAALVLDPPYMGAYTVLFFHGNAEDLANTRALLYDYRDRGYGAAACDYEGYGESSGVPSEEAVYRDADAIWEYLTDVKGIPQEKIIVAAFSVGSGPACYIAAKHDPAALVLEAPFASAFQAVLPIDFLPGDIFPNQENIKRIKCPLLIIHGKDDSTVPPRNAEKLYNLANSRKKLVIIPRAGHNDLRAAAGETYFREMEKIIIFK